MDGAGAPGGLGLFLCSLSPSFSFLSSLPLPWEINSSNVRRNRALSYTSSMTLDELPRLSETEPQFSQTWGAPGAQKAFNNRSFSSFLSFLLLPPSSVSFPITLFSCPVLWHLNTQRHRQAQLMAPWEILRTNLPATQTQHFSLPFLN